MIPKIVHYCWLSNEPIPDNMKCCMASWKEVLPDYEFMLWDFKRFPKHQSKWVSDAFDNRKFAFAADYIRLYALYNYGGIYMDMDVEVLKTFTPFLSLNTMICWQNGTPGLEVAAMGVEKGAYWIKCCLDYYDSNSFLNSDGSFNTKVMPEVIEDILRERGISLFNVSDLKEAKNVFTSIPVFPNEYFSPKNYNTKELNVTHNTVCIHHFDGSWQKTSDKLKHILIQIIGPSLTNMIVKIKRLHYKIKK